MNEHQARTILRKVLASWFLELDQLLRATPGELEDELEMYPVDGVSLAELHSAAHLARTNQWSLGRQA